MNPKVAALKTPQDCEVFARNATERGHPELGQQAHKRAVILRAAAHGATTDVERDAIAAVYAYEDVLSTRKGRRTRANRTWQMIHRHGVIPAVERIVQRPDVTIGFTALAERGLQEYAFEAVVLRYPSHFTPQTVARGQERMTGSSSPA